ncbi:MAG: glutathione S-transferase N-terminal domain-containing protein [Kiloniellaceae bacterium]
MKLRYSTTSPYVRKVNVTAIELGLDGRIERILTDTRDPESGLIDDNPLGKVPALLTEEGEWLYDSPVICEYLDSLHGGPKIFPAAGPARWRALRRQALADGILDATILRMLETARRPEGLQWPDWITHQAGKVSRALDRLEAESLDGPLTIGQITVGCALGYLDFRFADEDWRGTRPKLAAWYETFARRPSMRETVPRLPQ